MFSILFQMPQQLSVISSFCPSWHACASHEDSEPRHLLCSQVYSLNKHWSQASEQCLKTHAKCMANAETKITPWHLHHTRTV